MGRSKIKVELIQDDKKRMKTLVTRKAGLLKKISELSILCDIKACMIIYHEGNNSNCEMWPNDPNEVKEIINLYKNQPFEGRSKKGKTLSNYFKDDDQKKKGDEMKVENDPDSKFEYFENVEKKKGDDEIKVEKYPTWDSRFDYLSEKELQNLVGIISKRMENAKGKLELLNGSCSVSHQQQIWEYNNLMNQTTTISNNNLFQSNIPISSTVNSMGAGILDYQFCNANYSMMNESENWYGIGSSSTTMQHNMANNYGIGSSSTILHPMGNNYGIIDSSSTMMLPMGNYEIGSSSTTQPPMDEYPFIYTDSTHVIGSSSTMQLPMGQYPFTNNDESTRDIGSSSTMGNNNEIGSTLTMQPMDQYPFICNDSTYGFV